MRPEALGLTPGALQEALVVPCGRIRAIESALIGRFSFEVWRLDVSYTDDFGPTPIVLKRPHPEGARESLDRERRFYQCAQRAADVLGETPLRIPAYLGFLEAMDAILLEHVSGLRRFD